MSYSIYRLNGAIWENVMDATCDWLEESELIQAAQADVANLGLPAGRYAVTQNSAAGQEEFEFEVEPAAEPESPTVFEVKRLLEEAVSRLGETAHARYAGLGWADRNEMVIAIQRGQDPDQVVAWLGEE